MDLKPRKGNNLSFVAHILLLTCHVLPFIAHRSCLEFPFSINIEAYFSATQSSFANFVEFGSDVGVYFVQLSTTSTNSTVKVVKKKRHGKNHQSKIGSPCSPCKVLARVVSDWKNPRHQKARRE